MGGGTGKARSNLVVGSKSIFHIVHLLLLFLDVSHMSLGCFFGTCEMVALLDQKGQGKNPLEVCKCSHQDASLQ